MKIADRIITSLTALCAIPAALFAPTVHIMYKLTGWDILQSLLDMPGAVANDTGYTEDAISIWQVIKSLRNGSLSFGKLDLGAMDERVASVIPYFIWAACLFALAVVIAVVLCIVCASTNAKKVQIGICSAGIIDLSVCMVLFSKFSSPILSGDISSGTLLQSLMGGWVSESKIGSLLVSTIVDIQALNLSSSWVLLMMIFIAIIIWNISYMLTLPKKIK